MSLIGQDEKRLVLLLEDQEFKLTELTTKNSDLERVMATLSNESVSNTLSRINSIQDCS